MARGTLARFFVLFGCIAIFSRPLQVRATADQDASSYLDIYPPVNTTTAEGRLSCVSNSTSERCPLYIALTMSFGFEYFSGGVVAAVRYALDQINNDSSLLPGYSLHYTLTDSQCERTTSLGAFHTQIINPPTKIAVIGSGCSVATEPSAEISHFYNLTQLSCVTSSAALTNRIRYPSYFQLLSPDDDLADGFLAIIKHFGWQRVALIVQEENLLTVTMDRLKRDLEKNSIFYSERRFKSDNGVESLGDNPFDFDPPTRIFVIAMYSYRARQLMCKAYEHNIRYPQYLFLFYGWYVDKWWVGSTEEQEELRNSTMFQDCTVKQRESVIPYSLAPLQAEFLEDQDPDIVTTSGINGTEFRATYSRYLNETMSDFDKLNVTVVDLVYSEQCYDATWALAYALNDTFTECSIPNASQTCFPGLMSALGLQHFMYNNSQIHQKMRGHLEDTNFTGITGEITFNRSDGARRVGKTVVLSYQPVECNQSTEPCGGINMTRVGITDGENKSFTKTTTEDIWGPAGAPYDGVPENFTVTGDIALTATFISLGGLGFIFAVVCLCFNFIFREKPLIRLTSPNLNYLIGVGAIILYIDISISLAPTKDLEIVTALCNLAPWLNAIGYSLCFGTIVVKMFRVYYIFNNPTPNKKINIHDWMLVLIVLLLVGIDVIILTVFMAVEGARGRLGAVTVPDREIPQRISGELMEIMRYNIAICRSKSRGIALGVLYGYKGLLQVVAILFAFSIRKVKVKGLDDAKYIAIAVYVTSIVTAMIIVATYSLYDFRNALSIVLCTGIFLGATTILMLVFIPKMISLYKDPDGTSMFSKTRPVSSNHSKPHSRNFSLSAPRQGQSGISTTSEVESLRKRVKELEAKLSSVQEVESNGIHLRDVNMESV